MWFKNIKTKILKKLSKEKKISKHLHKINFQRPKCQIIHASNTVSIYYTISYNFQSSWSYIWTTMYCSKALRSSGLLSSLNRRVSRVGLYLSTIWPCTMNISLSLPMVLTNHMVLTSVLFFSHVSMCRLRTSRKLWNMVRRSFFCCSSASTTCLLSCTASLSMPSSCWISLINMCD